MPDTKPDVIYLDTNIIRSLTLSTSNQSFLELRNILTKFNNPSIPIIIPQTVSLEWFYHHYTTYKTKSNQTQSNIKELSLLLDNKQPKLKLPKDVFLKLSKAYKKKLKYLNFKVSKTPKNISINQLVLEATLKIRPFEEKGEKGFRDTIILFTILEDMKNNNYTNGIFVTEDEVFNHQDVKNKISKYKVCLEIRKSFNDITNYFKEILTSQETIKMQEQNKKLSDFVNSKSKEIFDFIINNANISEDFITKGGFLSTKHEIIGNLDKVLSFTPVRIESVFDRSKLFSNEKHSSNAIPLNISVQVDIKIVYSPYLYFNRPTVKASEIDNFKDALRNSNPNYYGNPVEKIVKRTVSVHGLLKQNNEGDFLNLSLENVYSF